MLIVDTEVWSNVCLNTTEPNESFKNFKLMKYEDQVHVYFN